MAMAEEGRGSALDEWRQRFDGAHGMAARDTSNLADILERVLDKGIVIAGDVVVNLVDVELLTIKLRLLVASVDKAREMGIDWWEHDPWLSSGARDGSPQQELGERLERLEQSVDRLASALDAASGSRSGS